MSHFMFQDISPAEALHRRIVHTEQRLEIMRELTELGMALARDLTRRALQAPERPEAAPEAAPAPRRDPADAFARLSRAIRLTLALEAKAEQQLSALRSVRRAPVAATPPIPADDPTPWIHYKPFPGDHSCPKRNRIRNAVFDTVDREVTGQEMEDFDLAHDILETTHDWLAEGKEFDGFVQLPLKAAVEAVFRYFKMQPDLSCWTEDGPPPSTRTPSQIWRRFWPAPGEPRLE
jgi:hypothetical protein